MHTATHTLLVPANWRNWIKLTYIFDAASGGGRHTSTLFRRRDNCLSLVGSSLISCSTCRLSVCLSFFLSVTDHLRVVATTVIDLCWCRLINCTAQLISLFTTTTFSTSLTLLSRKELKNYHSSLLTGSHVSHSTERLWLFDLAKQAIPFSHSLHFNHQQRSFIFCSLFHNYISFQRCLCKHPLYQQSISHWWILVIINKLQLKIVTAF